MHMSKTLICGLVGVGLVAHTPVATAETLQDALALAYQSNPTLRAQRAQLRATEELKAQAWARALPQISASAGIEENETTTTSLFGATDPNLPPQSQTFNFQPVTAGVSAEQTVFSGLQNYNAIKQARAQVRAGGAQLFSVEQQILQQVATAYFDVLRDTTVYEANLENVKVLLRQLDEARLRFEVGEITKTDVAQAEARLAGARAQLSGAQGQLSVSRAAYKEVVGAAPGTLEDNPPLPDVPETEEELQRLALLYAPGVIAARETEEASRRQVKIARGALAPSVALTARYQYAEEPSFFVLENEEFAYGARASVPIFQGGANYSRIREAKALNDADRQRIEEAERRASANVTAAWEQLVASRATIQSAGKQVEANTLALEGVRRENQVGARTTLDVLNAELELLNAQVALANARRDARAATFAALAAAGVLTLDAVGVSDSAAEDR